MPRAIDGSSPAEDAEVDAEEERLLDRQKRARRLAEQSWKDFFVSLGIRTVVIAAVVLALFWLLRLIVR